MTGPVVFVSDVDGSGPDEPVASRTARPRRPLVIGAAVLVALALTAFVAFRWGSAENPPPLATPTPEATPADAKLTTAAIYAALAPSVVTIEAVNATTNKVSATGTGVIANVDGLVLTAFHVVKGAGSIRLIFADGTRAAATILASDPTTDVAMLSPAGLPTVVVPAIIGNSGRLAVGDDVIAIGNQLGLTSSATAGVVSGLNRDATGNDGSTLSGLIQFDAAVNPGSSGGPLVNAKGETIGIVVALANPTEAGTFIGIGFAVPIGAAVATGGGGRGPQQ